MTIIQEQQLKYYNFRESIILACVALVIVFSISQDQPYLNVLVLILLFIDTLDQAGLYKKYNISLEVKRYE